MAGVSVSQGNAAPGENATITIRGITSFQDGGSGPLYVVDGVTYIENPNITPQEIESIEVFKDGASAAIYGSRASGWCDFNYHKKRKRRANESEFGFVLRGPKYYFGTSIGKSPRSICI